MADGRKPIQERAVPFHEAKNAWERSYLADLIERTGGNISRAAHRAQLARGQFYRLLKKHELIGER